jgi:hypothetical protein
MQDRAVSENREIMDNLYGKRGNCNWCHTQVISYWRQPGEGEEGGMVRALFSTFPVSQSKKGKIMKKERCFYGVVQQLY